MAPPRYGKINFEMISTWIGRSSEEDGPFWALNLMKYRQVAEYADGRETTRSGREADDEYVPRDSLHAIGAMITFAADVVDQRGSEPRWDRIGIVRYPSRAAFLEMQQRDDFKDKHVHKDAGMECTIVMSCLPVSTGVAGEGTLVLRVARFDDGATLAPIVGCRPVAAFGVEGVIVGDDRTWTSVAFDRCPDAATLEAALLASDGAAECCALAFAEPALDRLIESIVAAAEGGN